MHNAGTSQRHDASCFRSYLSPAAAAMAAKQSSEAAPGRQYRDSHIACCPCIESKALFKDTVSVLHLRRFSCC